MKKKQLDGINLLWDIYNNPKKYAHVMNVPSWNDVADTLGRMGHINNSWPISKKANANWNLN